MESEVNQLSVLRNRITALFNVLDASYAGGVNLSSSTKGTERELFVNTILRNVLPPHYRFSSGDVIDTYGTQSGQVDLVLEQPRGYSFPMMGSGPRLFLAENVAAIIEVKSDLTKQWNEVLKTSKKVAAIERKYASENFSELLDKINKGQVVINIEDKDKLERSLQYHSKSDENTGRPRIYFFAVGFRGWAKEETLSSKLIADQIDGIFVLDQRKYATNLGRTPGKEVVSGEESLLVFLHWLETAFSQTPRRFPAHGEYL